MRNTQISRGTRKKRSSKIAHDKKVDHIVVTPDVATNTHGPTLSLNGMNSLEPNQAEASRGNGSKWFYVSNDEGLDLVVDLDFSPSQLAQNYPLPHTNSDENLLVASKGKFKILDILEEAQHKASIRIENVKKLAMEEDIGCGDKLVVSGGAQLKTPIENEEPVKVIVEECIDCGDKSPVREGSQLTSRVDEHESLMKIEPSEAEAMEEDVGCDDKLLDSRQVATDFSLLDLTPSSLASGGMSGGGGGGNEAVVAEEEVVHMEDAVKLLVDHLVRPALPRRAAQDPTRHMTPEKQRAVAQQVHTAIILYNYYHRKTCPQLAFAHAKRFFVCASISVGEDLLPYVRMIHKCDNNPGNDVSLSVTDIAAIQACDTAAELSATQGYPDVAMWPIEKVAVLLLDSTRKNCFIQYGAYTKGVWSFIEKEYDAAAGISQSTNQPAGQESTDKTKFRASDGPFMLQNLAISEVERITGTESSDLLVLDEMLAYSLSKERTATKLFIVKYKQPTNGKLVKLSLEELISRMTGPVFINDPFPKTTSVVEYYHILPYKEILFELLHRKWPAEPRCELQPVIDEKMEEQDENSISKMRKQLSKVPTPKKNKRAIKEIGANSNQNSSISKQKKSSKRKAEAYRATAPEGPDGASPIIENKPLTVADVETSKLVPMSINKNGTAALSGGPVVLQSGGQVDKNKREKQSICENMALDVFPTKAPTVYPVINNSALEPQCTEVTEKSGGVTENNNDQMYNLLRSIQKTRDELLHKECIIQERSIQCDMDIRTILNEGKMTPKVLSIAEKYKGTRPNMTEVANSAFSGDGGQTISSNRKRLKELIARNKCQDLDEICNKFEWILPRYAYLPSVADGMFRATVHFACPDFDMSISGDPSLTPQEARCSAAANMIAELQKKAEEEE